MTMRRQLVAMSVVLALATAFLAGGQAAADDKDKDKSKKKGAEAMLVHNVFFTLKDRTPAARKKLVAACKKYLTKHPGEVYFAAGALAEDLKRPLNDLDFDVSLTIVFKNKAAHDEYQDAKRHKQFIEENKETWKKVRVFDSYATK